MKPFSLPIRHLLAMNILTSDDESRYVLNGVLFKFIDGQLYLVSVDGRRAGILKSVCLKSAYYTDQEFILYLKDFNFDVLEDDNRSVLVTVGTKEARIEIDGRAWIASIIDATFPNVSQVIPTTEPSTSTGEIFFDPFYCDSFVEIGRILGGKAHIAPYGDNPALVRIDRQDFLGLLMPMKSKEAIGYNPIIPKWIEDFKKARK